MEVTHSHSQSVTSLLDGEAGRRSKGGAGGEEKGKKKEIADPEVRGQGSSPDYRPIEELSARQAST